MTDSEPEYERREISVRLVLLIAGTLVAAAIIIHLALWFLEIGLYHVFPRGPVASRIAQPEVVVPPPRLQTDPTQDLRELMAREEAILGSYGWVEPNAGVVRIPIQRAMELVAQRGLPVRQSIPTEKP